MKIIYANIRPFDCYIRLEGKFAILTYLLALHKYCFLEKYCKIYILFVAFTILSGDTKAGQCVEQVRSNI